MRILTPFARTAAAVIIAAYACTAASLVEKPAGAWNASAGASLEPAAGGVRVTVPAKGDKSWSIRLSAQPTRAVKKGEQIRVAFTVRNVNAAGGTAHAFLKLQLAAAPYDALAQKPVDAGAGVTVVELKHIAARDYPAGSINLDLHVGQQPQSFDIINFIFEAGGNAMSASTKTSGATLKQVYAKRFDVGAAISGPNMKDAEIALLTENFTTITPENCMKPQPIHPAEDRYAFEQADALVDFAAAKGLTVNAHCLVWHSQCPDWFFKDGGGTTASREKVLERMRAHIATVAGRYRGKVKSWDVVNEAIDDGSDYLRKSKWLETIGEDFIAEAFKAAKAADPGAELYYNDYSIEGKAKRAKTVKLIRDLKERGAPIDGVGIQGHWGLNVPLESIEIAINEFRAEGVKVMITELDLDVVPRKTQGANAAARESGGDDPYTDGLPSEIQEKLAAQYAALFKLFMKYPETVTRVTFWGLHDGRSWLNGWPRKRTNHPLLWGRDLSPKPAFQAVLDAAGE